MQKGWKTFVMLTLFAAACNNPAPTNAEVKTDTNTVTITNPPVVDSVISGCYSLIANRDTASLQLQVKGSEASGSLSYNLFEKDHNDGTFEGEIRNDIILGWYLFRSEGMMSVRQVAWKIGHGSLSPAIGEVTVTNDTARFVNTDKLSFDSSRVFVKVRCVI